MSDDIAAHTEAIAHADDYYGPDELPEDYERHYCEEDGLDWPCRTVLIAQRDDARAALTKAEDALAAVEYNLFNSAGYAATDVVRFALLHIAAFRAEKSRPIGISDLLMIARAEALEEAARWIESNHRIYTSEHGAVIRVGPTLAAIRALATPAPKPEEAS